MQTFRLVAHAAQQAGDRHCIEVVLTNKQLLELCLGMHLAIEKNPGALGITVPFYGTLEQHHQEWRPAELAAACASPSAEDADE